MAEEKEIYADWTNKRVQKQFIDQEGAWLMFEDGFIVQLHDNEICDREDSYKADEIPVTIKDKNGESIGIGESFYYRSGDKLHCKGTLTIEEEVIIIIWDDDNTDTIPLADFWYDGTDEKKTTKIEV